MYEWVYMPHPKPGIVQVYAHVHIYVHICVLTCMSCIEMYEWIYASFQAWEYSRTCTCTYNVHICVLSYMHELY